MSTGFWQKMRRDERGTFILLMALSLLGIFGFAALSIDIGHVYQQKRDMQSATDAAALAGVGLLTNSSPDKAAIIQAAQTIALSNGVSLAEITAATAYDGAIEVGTWDTNNTPPFTANTSPSSTWNAVRVPAKRNVGLIFGKLTILGGGFAAMSPVVHTVAVRSYPNQAYDVVPFMLTTNYASNPFGTQLQFTKNEYKDTGNFGKASFPGTTGDFGTQMQNGCNCTLSISNIISGVAGNSDVSGGLNNALGRNVVVPIVNELPANHGDVMIVGFAVIHIDAVDGNGNWTVTFTLVDAGVGIGTGGPPSGTPFAFDRLLVE